MEDRAPYRTAPPPPTQLDLTPILRWLEAHAAPHVARGGKVQVTLHFADGRFQFGDAHLMTIRPEKS